jgi:hypothetical protein
MHNTESKGNSAQLLAGSISASVLGRIPIGVASEINYYSQILNLPTDNYTRQWAINNFSATEVLGNVFTSPLNHFDTLKWLGQNVLSGDLVKYGPDWELIKGSVESVAIIALPLVIDTAIHSLSTHQDELINSGANRVRSALQKFDTGLHENLGIQTCFSNLTNSSSIERVKKASHKILDIWGKPWVEPTKGKDTLKKWLVRTPIDGLLATATVAAVAHKTMGCVGVMCG